MAEPGSGRIPAAQLAARWRVRDALDPLHTVAITTSNAMQRDAAAVALSVMRDPDTDGWLDRVLRYGPPYRSRKLLYFLDNAGSHEHVAAIRDVAQDGRSESVAVLGTLEIWFGARVDLSEEAPGALDADSAGPLLRAEAVAEWRACWTTVGKDWTCDPWSGRLWPR